MLCMDSGDLQVRCFRPDRVVGETGGGRWRAQGAATTVFPGTFRSARIEEGSF